MPNLSPRNGLSDKAYTILKARILSGEFPLGSPLSRRNLADSLRMSSLPVSDAIQRLETEGLVESQPQVGTWVRIPTPDEIRGRYMLREALEVQCARLFTRLAGKTAKKKLLQSAVEIDALWGTLEQLPDAKRSKVRFEVHRLHAAFHESIAKAAQCVTLSEALAKTNVLVFNWLYDASAHMPSPPPDWHLILGQALSSGDVDEADRVMRHHVVYRMEEVIRMLGPYLELRRSQSRFRRKYKIGE